MDLCYPTLAELGWGTHSWCWARIAKSKRRSFGRRGDLGMTLQWATGDFGCVIGSPGMLSFTR